MLTADAKQRAWAAMEDAAAFRLVVAAAPPPAGADEHCAWVCDAADLDAMASALGLVRKMARTFFGTKLEHVAPPPDGEGPFGLYVVARVAELDDLAIGELDDP